MMSHKRFFGIVLVMLLLLSSLAACAQPTSEEIEREVTRLVEAAPVEVEVEREVTRIVEGTPVVETEVIVVTATPAPPSEGPEGTVLLWSAHGGNLGQILQDLVFRFNASNQNINVVNEFQGDYYQTLEKFLAGMAARTVPDIVMLDCMYTPFFASNGAFAPLDEFVNGPNGIDPDDLLTGLREGDKWNDQFYAWSFARSTPLLYINATAFEEAGLDPVPPATWDELVDAARQLTVRNASGQVEQYGFILHLRNWWYVESMFRSNGGRIFDPGTNQATLSEPEQLEVLQAIQDLIDEGVFTTSPNSPEGQADFLQGNGAMAFMSTAALADVKNSADFEVEVGFLPRWDEYAVTPGGACFAIANASENKEAAWEFLNWITSPEITAEYATRTGYLPLRKSATNTPRMAAFYTANPQFKVAVDQAEYAAAIPLIKAVPSVVEDFFTMQEELFVGGASVEETAVFYDERMTSAFEDWLSDQE